MCLEKGRIERHRPIYENPTFSYVTWRWNHLHLPLASIDSSDSLLLLYARLLWPATRLYVDSGHEIRLIKILRPDVII